MGKAVSISLLDFQKKIFEQYKDEWNNETLQDIIDLNFCPLYNEIDNLYSVDAENWEIYGYNITGFGGYKVLNNIPILEFGCGGDWEEPVHLVLYWDGSEIKCYAPENGNTFNKKYRTAYGSEEDGIYWPWEKNNPGVHYSVFSEQNKDKLEELEKYLESDEYQKELENIKPDYNLMLQDIMNVLIN